VSAFGFLNIHVFILSVMIFLPPRNGTLQMLQSFIEMIAANNWMVTSPAHETATHLRQLSPHQLLHLYHPLISQVLENACRESLKRDVCALNESCERCTKSKIKY